MFTLICLKNKNYKLVRMFSLTKLRVEFGSHSWYNSYVVITFKAPVVSYITENVLTKALVMSGQKLGHQVNF